MEQEHIWDLIAKKLSGEASEQELSELAILLRGNPDLHYPMQTISDLWESNKTHDKEEALQAFDRHMGRMQLLDIDFTKDASFNPEPTSKNKKKIYFFSVLATVIAAGLFIYIKTSNTTTDHQAGIPKTNSEIYTRNGSKTNLVLPDGSVVWLNSGSKLSYDKNFDNSLREVSLTGEAFFDVVPSISLKTGEKIPFIIHANKIDIKVLGTAFNVKSYPGEKTIETSLLRGSIEVTFKDRPTEKVILKPNEKLVVANEEVPVATVKKHAAKQNEEPIVAISHLNYRKSDSSIIETAWVQNKLIFQDKSFKDLAKEMERWYGVVISFDESERDTLHFTGSFENETVQQALEALKLTAHFNYAIHDNKIDISK